MLTGCPLFTCVDVLCRSQVCEDSYYRTPTGSCASCDDDDNNVTVTFAGAFLIVVFVIAVSVSLFCVGRRKIVSAAAKEVARDALTIGMENTADDAKKFAGGIPEGRLARTYGKIMVRIKILLALIQVQHVGNMWSHSRDRIATR